MRLLQQLKRLLRMDAPQGTSSQATSQPIPQVTPDDVERVVCRDFTADEYITVAAMLNEYGTEKWHREPMRVQLAALKVANGSMQKLRACVDSAKRDYRDALTAAEYPAYCKIGFRVRELPEKDRRRIIDEDWRQYEEWLKK
jgi:hypothetical protein